MMLKFASTGLFVDNMEVMAKFYRDVIGLEIGYDAGGYKSFKTGGGVSFTLCERKIMFNGLDIPPLCSDDVNYTMQLCFDVAAFSDVDREFERITKAGGKPFGEPSTAPWGMRSCFISDPEGNLIELCSTNDDSASVK